MAQANAVLELIEFCRSSAAPPLGTQIMRVHYMVLQTEAPHSSFTSHDVIEAALADHLPRVKSWYDDLRGPIQEKRLFTVQELDTLEDVMANLASATPAEKIALVALVCHLQQICHIAIS